MHVQLFLLCFNRSMAWNINTELWAYKAISWLMFRFLVLDKVRVNLCSTHAAAGALRPCAAGLRLVATGKSGCVQAVGLRFGATGEFSCVQA